MNTLKPPRLQKGDLIGLISPASPPSAREKIDKGAHYLERLGYRVKIGKNVMAEHGYLAGTDDQRAGDLNDMIGDRNVKAIFAVRGGYGTPRLLQLIDYAALKRNPKIIVGYSDLTALQLAIFRKTGLVTFSGPMTGVEMWNSIDPYTEEHFWRTITSRTKVGPLPNPPEEPSHIIKHGKASGRLIGGNLSLLLSLFATPYCPDLRDSILIIEDVDEAPHRVDRMLAQLYNAGLWKKIAGLVIGRFTDCVPSDPSKPHLTVEQVLQEAMEKVPCPVIGNFQYGHIPRKLTLPLGLRTRLETKAGLIEVVESAVV
ncbi:MAG: LD-carboxypeptidase [Ignavibacteriales bacterium]|nr:LD-carboxypeptidase [Ignavibacteriales bacterium]